MEAHARAVDLRLTTYCPEYKYDFEVYRQTKTRMENDLLMERTTTHRGIENEFPLWRFKKRGVVCN